VTRASSVAAIAEVATTSSPVEDPMIDSMIDDIDTPELMRNLAIGALYGGLSFIREKLGEAEFARTIARAKGRDPIVQLVEGPLREKSIASESRPMPARGTDTSGPSHPAEPSKFLDEKQLCSELGISSVTATKWRRNAEGPPFVRVGRLIRYPRVSVDAWIASRTVGVSRSK
jgi:predicted DNA-binding transcriptional regulator AlpA